jgi:hypothetical protein
MDSDKLLEGVYTLHRMGRYEEALGAIEELLKEHEANRSLRHMYLATLLDLRRYREAAEYPLASSTTPGFAVIAADLADAKLDEVQTLWLGPAPELTTVAVIMMAKDEDDIIGANLRWHYHLGVRRFCIIDNESTDHTRREILAFKGEHRAAVVFVIDDPIIGYFQCAKTNALFRFAVTLWPELEWVIPIDADEFLCCTRSLGVCLDEASEKGADGVFVPKSYYYLVADAFSEGARFHDNLIYRDQLTHVSTKVIVRNRPGYTISAGNHLFFAPSGEKTNYLGGYGLGLHYREFGIRSLEHTRKKVINGGRAILEAEKIKGMNAVGGFHWKAWYEAYLKDGETAIENILHSHLKSPNNLIRDPLPLQACYRSEGQSPG